MARIILRIRIVVKAGPHRPKQKRGEVSLWEISPRCQDGIWRQCLLRRRLLGDAHRFLQLGLVFCAQVGAQNGGLELGDLRDNLVLGHFGDHEEQGGLARLYRLAHFLDEAIVDAEVAELARESTRDGADGQAHPGHEEEQADQHAPEGPAQRARADQVVSLLDLDLAIIPAGDQGGIGQRNQELSSAYRIGTLPIAFAVTALIRTAQGSATVAMITAVGVLGGLAGSGHIGFHPLYLALAIGCGSKPIPWLNDSGFWVICKMSGMTEGETLKTATAMMSLMGFTGLLVIMLAARFLPLV